MGSDKSDASGILPKPHCYNRVPGSHYERVMKVPGLRSIHCAIPMSKFIMQVKKIFDFVKTEILVILEDINVPSTMVWGWYNFWNGMWWVVCILEQYDKKKEARVSFLHPHRSSKSFPFLSKKKIGVVGINDMLIIVCDNFRILVEVATAGGSKTWKGTCLNWSGYAYSSVLPQGIQY